VFSGLVVGGALPLLARTRSSAGQSRNGRSSTRTGTGSGKRCCHFGAQRVSIFGVEKRLKELRDILLDALRRFPGALHFIQPVPFDVNLVAVRLRTKATGSERLNKMASLALDRLFLQFFDMATSGVTVQL
jgi:hypothetical protein